MLVSLKWLLICLILSLTNVFAQEPRKRSSNLFAYSAKNPADSTDEDISCSIKSCLKRSAQDEMGPFWANRGKKDPMYTDSKLYAEQPQWILVRRDDKNFNNDEPFYVARGKKSPQMDDDENQSQFLMYSDRGRLRFKRNEVSRQDINNKKRHGSFGKF